MGNIIVKSLIKPFLISLSIQVNIRVKFSRTNQTQKIEIKENSTVDDLLKKMNLKPDTVIVMEKDKPIPMTDILANDQELTILQVSSGG